MSAASARYRQGVPAAHALLIVATIAIVLRADAFSDVPGQMLLSAAVWLVLFYVLQGVQSDERRALIACLVIATAGEIVLSLVWRLYTYRLGNVPMFVPPGHVLMLLLGLSLARAMPQGVAWAILGGAALYSLGAAVTGFDTLGIALFLILAVSAVGLPKQRTLCASTFVLSLLLELYGTWLGNWNWAHEVPATALVTTNPPGVVGAFYCALDAAVAAVSMLLARRWSARAAS
jgi:cytochrome c oxidase subunit IV